MHLIMRAIAKFLCLATITLVARCAIQNCNETEIVDQQEVCKTCNPKFFKESGGKLCSACPANCFECQSKDVCTACDTGFYSSDSGICFKCSSWCSKCKGPNDCTWCNKGYYVKSGICDSCSSNCVECSIKSNCLTCSDPYVLKRQDLANSSCEEKSSASLIGIIAGVLGFGALGGLIALKMLCGKKDENVQPEDENKDKKEKLNSSL